MTTIELKILGPYSLFHEHRMDGWVDGRMNGRKGERKKGKKERRKRKAGLSDS